VEHSVFKTLATRTLFCAADKESSHVAMNAHVVCFCWACNLDAQNKYFSVCRRYPQKYLTKRSGIGLATANEQKLPQNFRNIHT
jgi:hypothetical protein